MRLRRWSGLAGLALALGSGAPAFAQLPEVEPNDGCLTGQALGEAATPLEVAGALQAGTLDFFRFSATPGRVIDLELGGVGEGAAALAEPVLGVFDESCQRVSFSQASEDGRVRTTVVAPASGLLIAAVSGEPDTDFRGVHTQEGAYQLLVLPGELTIGAISGRVVDENGAPLSNHFPALTSVELEQCSGTPELCEPTFSHAFVGDDGRFEFQGSFVALSGGRYRVSARAEGYQPGATAVAEIASGASHDFGDLALELSPYGLDLVSGCDANGLRLGVCRFLVRVTNRTEGELRGLVWSSVFASTLAQGPFLGFSSFEASAAGGARAAIRHSVTLAAGASRELRFQFPVQASEEGSSYCTSEFLGLEPAPLVNVVRQSFDLFCLTPGVSTDAGAGESSRVVRGAEARRLGQRARENNPGGGL